MSRPALSAATTAVVVLGMIVVTIVLINEPREVAIRDETIRLGQLLKLAGLAESGGHARMLVQDGDVLVNGEVDLRRGRQLRRGDLVTVDDETVRVA